MAKYNKLSKMVANAKKNCVAQDFLDELNYCIELENKSTYIPSKSFKPSGISGCKRALYYELKGVQPDEDQKTTELTGICESGTDRHESIQSYVMRMQENGLNCEWLDVGEYVRKNNIDAEVVSQNGNETKLFSKKYNMRFLCDGLIRYKGELYILEIKTEASNKFMQHDRPWPDHIQQATCYSMVLEVPKVIFLYENRDICSKKAFLVEVTDLMIKRVEGIINEVNRFVSNNELPPKENKCKYCKYRTQCARDGERD